MPAPDLVLGIDSSTTATKVVAFARDGEPVATARQPHPTSRPLPMHAEQDPEDWWNGLGTTLKAVTREVGADRIAALCITHQRETFALLDAAGKPVRPGILWIDERSRPQVETLGHRIGIDRLRQITGKHPDPTPALYALAWLRDHEPEAMRRAAMIVDVHGFLVSRLTGRAVTSTASADPLGLLDTGEGGWSDELLAAVGLNGAHMPGLAGPGAVIGRVTPEASAWTGLAIGTNVVAGGGDGQFCGLGLGILDPTCAYLSLGSGAVCGMHAERYAHSTAFRTLTSPSGEGFILETCIRTCTQLLEWILRLVAGPDGDIGQTLTRLEAEATGIAPGADGLLLVPYWSGVMSPYWEAEARGTITGLSLDHTPAHLFRATLEGIALEQAVALGAMEAAAGRKVSELVITGGGSANDLWCRIVASATGRPVRRPIIGDAGCVGAAIAAAAGAGWHASIAAAAGHMAPKDGDRFAPEPAWRKAYVGLLEPYARLYPAVAAALRP